ncbi:MAG: glycogen/starch/alpha-glucan family phosphorylase [Neisseriaceae bacterium]|nr:MAG: glycogen/starch/alpha-glucan family phosphorylase [Neisseriaceae bacterium]
MSSVNTIENELTKLFATSLDKATNEQIYYALLKYVNQRLQGLPQKSYSKKIYYISSEFLIGKMLSNNLINLGIYDDLKILLAKHNHNLSDIEAIEPEPSLGNGGLGRLAACFLDSIASLGIPGVGVSINYHFGLFRQVFKNNLQNEVPNPWVDQDGSWLRKTNTVYDVKFAEFDAKARLYEIDIVGYNKARVNTLALFDIESADESIVKDGINFDKTAIEKNLSLFLYPDDSDENGHLLRIFQQYFMVSNAVSLIFDDFKKNGWKLTDLPKHAVVQINDTHPTMVIPELIRRLTNEGVAIDKAIELVKQTVAYTNHTILAEALEKWPHKYLQKVVPHLLPIIEYLDKQVRSEYPKDAVEIIDKDNRVHMAHIAIHYSFSVNGVAALHTDILKQSELKKFHKLYPNKFNNKTNGITFRRWLLATNPELVCLLTELIGDGFKTDAMQLEKLLPYQNDAKVIDTILSIKQTKKKQFVEFAKERYGVQLNPESIFDVQIKRMHEYKRQQMNALYIAHKYLEVKAGKLPKRPLTFIFGGKAAPAYIVAKDIIHFILCLQELISKDPVASKYLQILFVENYNVTVAEKLIPAADVSEQISLASKEASGTGNMKFMLNGAITLGTMDGANVEIAELVGKDNIYTFGKDSDTIINLYETSGYKSNDYYKNSKVIKSAVDMIISPEIQKLGTLAKLKELHNELLVKDWFMTLIDLEEYIQAKDKIFADYEDRQNWAKMSVVNISKAGFFSSDRTIAEYNRDIWKI